MGQRGKHFRRGLSILLSLLMILGAVPLFSFAAELADVVEVYAKSADYVYLTKALLEDESQNTAIVGTRLGDYQFRANDLTVPLEEGEFTHRGVTMKYYDPETGKTKNCLASKCTVEFVNKDDVVKNVGTNRELVRISGNPYGIPIWVEYWFTFEAVEGSGISPAEITEPPVVSPAKYVENMTASDLTLTGGKANVEGTFAFTEPDQAVYPATTEVSVTFTPDDPTSAEAVTFTVPVTIEMGDIVVTEAPTYQYTYQPNRELRYAFSGAELVEEGEMAPSLSAVKVDFYGEHGSGYSDEQASKALQVGEHTVTARMTAKNFNEAFHPVKIIVTPNSTTALPLSAVVTEENTLQLSVRYSDYQYGTCNGTVTYKVNGEVAAEGQKIDAVVTYPVTESGSYEIEAVYTPAEGDGFHFLPASVTREVVLPHTVTVEGGSGSGSYRPGDTVRVEFDTTLLGKYDVFNGWGITNAAGETLDVGVVDLTQRTISFTMPDEAVTITADTSFSIQLFFQSIGEAILNFLMKVVEWFMGLFDGLGSLVG